MSKPDATTQCPRCRGTGRLPDAKIIGSAMKAKREAAGLTLEAVGEACGWTRQYVFMIEMGHRPWSNETLDKFEAALVTAKAVPPRSQLDRDRDNV